MGLTRTRFAQSNTAIARIQDPITVLNSDSTVANVDIGFLINRNQGIKANAALYWNESASTFVTALTANTGVIDSNITVASYADLKVGSLFGNIGGGNTQANTYISGSLIPSANVTYDLGSSTNRFRSLWLSGSTLYLGSESVSVDGAGVWTFTSAGDSIILGPEASFANITVTGNLNLQGSSSTFDSNNLAIQDSIIRLHTPADLAPLTGDDGRDIGLDIHYFKGADNHAFLGWSNDSGYLEWYDSGYENASNIFVGNTYGTIKSGAAWLVNTTPSTSTTTGALRIAGGVGIAGNLYIANTGDVSSNIGTIKTNFDLLDASVSAYQTYANANAVSQQTTIDSLSSNAAAQQAAIISLDANVGTITNDLSSLVSGANSNVAAYLLTATGNIAASNFIATGNIYGGLVPSAIFKDVYLGTTAVSLARGSGALTVDNFNTTGYAAQANLATVATNSLKTTVSSNLSSGTAYVTFVSAATGNVDQNINTALTYNPNSGNLRTYTAFVDTDLIVGGNLTVQNISYTNQEIITTTEISQGNLVANSGVDSTSNVTGAVVVRGGIGATGNVYTKTLYTQDGIRWAGNGNVFASGGGGTGVTYTADTAPPASGNIEGDQWYNTTTNVLYEYLDDGTSKYWVDTQSPILFANTSTTINVLGETTITGNLVPSANITYSLGTTTQRFKDLFLSGTTIDLGGATIKTDASSGAIALIPQPTVANPNPTGIVVSPAGTVSTVSTTGGELSANAISDSSNSAVASGTTTFGNIIANGNITANRVSTVEGLFWSNGTAFASSSYGNTEVAAYLVANPQGSTYSNSNVASYFTSNISGISSRTDAITIPIGTTAQRPTATANGMMRYNVTLGSVEVYLPSGGWTSLISDRYTVEYLVVAGGGGGASRHSGGGGAGGMLTATGFTVTPTTAYTVTVGAGGAGSTNTGTATDGSPGFDSVFASITATGGGKGGGTSPATGGNGGSGGGGGNGALGGSGVAGQGYAGGKNASPTYDYHGGGGGGAGGVGGDVTGGAGGTGGLGLASDITGTSVIYACGGGGSAYQGLGSGGEGGAGGSSNVNGGKGAGSTSGSAGTSNTGTGGGGGSGGEGAYNGGSGVVIVRYLGPQRGSGGTYSTSGGYSIHKFTGSGTFTA